jgi:hypothetical protein
MHAALKRVVQYEHVARLDFAVEGLPDRRHRRRHRAEMAWQSQPLCHQFARPVEHRGRVVHIVLQHARIGRPKDRQRHLVGDREQRILEQLEFDRVADHRGHSPSPGHIGGPCRAAPARKPYWATAITHLSTWVPGWYAALALGEPAQSASYASAAEAKPAARCTSGNRLAGGGDRNRTLSVPL